jgi:hypothetical protein
MYNLLTKTKLTVSTGPIQNVHKAIVIQKTMFLSFTVTQIEIPAGTTESQSETEKIHKISRL